MSRSRSTYVKILKRRLEYLEQKLSNRDHTDKSKMYLNGEIFTLRWAIPILEDHIQQTKDPNR